jgi:hypothetical protein
VRGPAWVLNRLLPLIAVYSLATGIGEPVTFRVHILRLFHSEDNGIKYVMRLQPEGVIGRGTQFVQYGNDAALCDALSKLNVTEPQQQRALSVLLKATQENFSVDISEDVARQFGRPPIYSRHGESS